MGFAGMAALTHEMEDVFELLRQRKHGLQRAEIDVCLECLDALEAAVDAIETGGADYFRTLGIPVVRGRGFHGFGGLPGHDLGCRGLRAADDQRAGVPGDGRAERHLNLRRRTLIFSLETANLDRTRKTMDHIAFRVRPAVE